MELPQSVQNDSAILLLSLIVPTTTSASTATTSAFPNPKTVPWPEIHYITLKDVVPGLWDKIPQFQIFYNLSMLENIFRNPSDVFHEGVKYRTYCLPMTDEKSCREIMLRRWQTQKG